MSKMYLLTYTSGVYDSYHEKDIFVTADKKKATKYVTKFNRILKKWKKYYSQFENNENGFNWIDEKYINEHYKNWSKLRDINECYWQLIEIR